MNEPPLALERSQPFPAPAALLVLRFPSGHTLANLLSSHQPDKGMFPQYKLKPAFRPIRFYLTMREVMQRPAGGVLDLASGHSQGDTYGLADRVQVCHAVAATVFCPAELPFLPDYAAHRIRVGRRADPVERDAGDSGLPE